MKRLAVGVLVVLLVLGTVAVPVAAQLGGQAGVGFGGITVTEEDQLGTVTRYGGDAVIRGTVTGDVVVYGGDVEVAEGGEVRGRIRAYGGEVSIAGTVGSNVLAYGGQVDVTDTGSVGATFGAVANRVTIDGEMSRDVIIIGDVVLENDADVGGSVYYTGTITQREGAQVSGPVQSTSDLDLSPAVNVPGVLVVLFGFLTNLLLGVLLLLGFPDTSGRVADRLVGSPLESGAAAIVTLVGVPIVALVLAITVIGLPIALALVGLFGIALWVGGLYARIAIGAFLLQFTEVDQWWAPLVVGLVLVTILVNIPVVGGILNAIITAFGLGALALGGVEWYAGAEPDRG